MSKEQKEEQFEHYYYSKEQEELYIETNEIMLEVTKKRKNYCLVEDKEQLYTECKTTNSKDRPENGSNFPDAIYLGTGNYSRMGNEYWENSNVYQELSDIVSLTETEEPKKYEHYYYSEKQREVIAEINDFEFNEQKIRQNFCLINGEKERRMYTECKVTGSKDKPEIGTNFEDATYLGEGEWYGIGNVIKSELSIGDYLQKRNDKLAEALKKIPERNLPEMPDIDSPANYLSIAEMIEKHGLDPLASPALNKIKDIEFISDLVKMTDEGTSNLTTYEKIKEALDKLELPKFELPKSGLPKDFSVNPVIKMDILGKKDEPEKGGGGRKPS
jgi:hypothetical protein